MQAALHRGLSDLTNTLLPSDCRICAAPMVAFGKVRVCEDCVARVGANNGSEQEVLCSRCGDALGMESARFGAALGITECTLCRLAPPEFTRAVAFCTYDHEMREMLHLLKFDGQRHIAEHVLGRRMAEAVLKLRPHTASDLIVIPVPLFAAHERQRGFNQAMLLAQSALKHLRRTEPGWNLRILPRVLSRVRDTHALYRLNPSQRRANLRGAFRVLDKPAILGREVLLIDDILTTGATARECSRVLLAAGAARVWVATAARAQPESPQALATFKTQNVAMWDATPARRPIEPDIGRRKTF
jgi:ComF family protein